jgi:hypothetical protein
MIVLCDIDTATTNGCGCCSEILYMDSNQTQILEELKQNIIVAKEVCLLLDVNFDEFIKPL